MKMSKLSLALIQQWIKISKTTAKKKRIILYTPFVPKYVTFLLSAQGFRRH